MIAPCRPPSDRFLADFVPRVYRQAGFGTVEWLWLNLNYKLVPGGNILTGPSYINKDNVARISELVKSGYR